MSVFDNKELINMLVNAGIEFNNKFAQQNTNQLNPQYEQLKRTFELAKSLGVNMQRDLKDPNAAKKIVPVSTQTGTSASFSMSDGRTLGHFIDWAARNKILWNGKRIAWLEDDASKPTNAWTFESLDSDLSKRDDNNQPIKKLCYADKDGLINYLTYLRDEAVPSSQDPKPFEIVVKSLIGELNRSLPRNEQLNVKTNPEDKGPELDLNLIVDAFPDDKIIPDKNGRDMRGLESAPDFRNMRGKLTVGNLQNAGAFFRWLMGMTIKKPDENKFVNVMDYNEGDPCLAIRVLYNRALALNANAQAYIDRQPKYVEMIDKYLQAIKNFGPQLGDPKTQESCSLTVTNTKTKENEQGSEGKTKDTEAVPGGAGLNRSQVLALGNLLNMLPLEAHNINFIKIKQFMEAYANFDRSIAGGKGSMAKQASDEALRIIDNIQHRIMANAYPAINLTLSPQDISTSLKKGFKYMMDFCDNLKQLIVNTSNVINALYVTYGRVINQNPTYRSLILQQINQYTRSNTSQIANWQDLTRRTLK